MQSLTLALSVISTLLVTCLASGTTVTEYFLLKTSLLPGQTDKSAFDDLYVYSPPVYLTPYVHTVTGTPLLSPINDNADIFNFEPVSQATAEQPDLYYWQLNFTAHAAQTDNLRAQMEFNGASGALWQSLSLIKIGNDQPSQAKNINGTNQFYVKNGTEGRQLEWYNSGAINKQDKFQQWLVCDWQFGHPQLFFTVKANNDFHEFKVLPTCAQVDLLIIPVPPSQS